MGNEGFSTGIANRPNLVIDSNGNLYVSYRSDTTGKISVMKYDNQY